MSVGSQTLGNGAAAPAPHDDRARRTSARTARSRWGPEAALRGIGFAPMLARELFTPTMREAAAQVRDKTEPLRANAELSGCGGGGDRGAQRRPASRRYGSEGLVVTVAREPALRARAPQLNRALSGDGTGGSRHPRYSALYSLRLSPSEVLSMVAAGAGPRLV